MTGFRLTLLAALLLAPVTGYSEAVVLDTIVASVNEKPIALSDVLRRLPGQPRLSAAAAAGDPAVRQAVDDLIMEQLIEDDAAARRLSASDSEVDRYIDEIARRNNLSREAFQKVLADEKRDYETYRRQVKIDILRSKLTQAVMQGGAAVTTAEVERYLEEHPELARTGSKLKLQHIVLEGKRHTEEAARAKLEELRAKTLAGDDFGALAAANSEAPNAADGGSLGVVAEKDLSPEIFDAVFALKTGEVSGIISTGGGYHIFRVEERFSGDEGGDRERLITEVRRMLQEQKTQLRMHTYFTSDLFKQHAVDKKI